MPCVHQPHFQANFCSSRHVGYAMSAPRKVSCLIQGSTMRRTAKHTHYPVVHLAGPLHLLTSTPPLFPTLSDYFTTPLSCHIVPSVLSENSSSDTPEPAAVFPSGCREVESSSTALEGALVQGWTKSQCACGTHLYFYRAARYVITLLQTNWESKHMPLVYRTVQECLAAYRHRTC